MPRIVITIALNEKKFAVIPGNYSHVLSWVCRFFLEGNMKITRKIGIFG
jgi:hypothetical protein